MCTGAEGLSAAGSSGGMGGYASVIGGIAGAASSLRTGSQTKAFDDYKANQAEADANAEEQLGQVRGDKVRKAGKVAMGQARAAFGASGVDVSAGSSLAVQANIQRNVSTDALTELLTGQRRAATLRATAQGDRSAGDIAMQDAYGGASKSLLSSYATSMRDKAAANRYTTTRPPTYVTPGDYYMEN